MTTQNAAATSQEPRNCVAAPDGLTVRRRKRRALSDRPTDRPTDHRTCPRQAVRRASAAEPFTQPFFAGCSASWCPSRSIDCPDLNSRPSRTPGASARLRHTPPPTSGPRKNWRRGATRHTSCSCLAFPFGLRAPLAACAGVEVSAIAADRIFRASVKINFRLIIIN